MNLRVARLTSHLSHLARLATPSLVVTVLACGGGHGPGKPGPEKEITETLPLDQLYVLEARGVPPNDTTVRFKVGESHIVILRHAAPDNAVFAELVFPAAMFKIGEGTESVTVVAAVRPGIYGIDLATTLLPDKTGIIRFKYPVHFSAPLGALEKYGSALRYERALQIGRENNGGQYALFQSIRRASDNLEAVLVGPGRYLVGAPK